MSNKIPADRLQLAELAPKGYAAMFRLSGSIQLDHEIRELIDIRASQINGCAFCLDMHCRDARAAGEDQRRLDVLSAWREAPELFSEKEQAALALTEAVTLIGQSGVPDDIWEQATKHFGKPELVSLLMAIATINVWNRLLIATHRALPDLT